MHGLKRKIQKMMPINEAGKSERESDNDLPESGLGCASHTLSSPVTAPSANVVQVDDNVTSQSTMSSSTRKTDILQYFPTLATSISNQSVIAVVACPTCHVKFPVREIEEHAD